MTELITDDNYRKVKTMQDKNNAIMQTEIARIKAKTESVIQKSQYTERDKIVSQSQRDRQQQYLRILLIVIIVFALVLFILFLTERVGIQSRLLDLGLWLIVFIGIIYIYNIYADVARRDQIYFDKIDFKEETHEAATSSNQGQPVPASCFGANCCEYRSFTNSVPSGHTYWDTTLNRCKKL